MGGDRCPASSPSLDDGRGVAQPPAANRSTIDDEIGCASGGSGNGNGGGGGGGGAHLRKLVLKFTTASDSDVQPSCEVDTVCCT